MQTELFVLLKKLAKKKNKSLNQIEKDLNYPRNALTNYRHNSNPSSTRVFQLAQYFDVSPQYLMGEPEYIIKNLECFFNNLTTPQKQQLCLICQTWLVKDIVE